MCSKFSRIKTLSVLAGFAAGLAIAPAAMAQDEGSPPTPEVNIDSSEGVTITSQRRAPARNAVGAPIQEVTMSMPVSYSDLNLHTGQGVSAEAAREIHRKPDLQQACVPGSDRVPER